VKTGDDVALAGSAQFAPAPGMDIVGSAAWDGANKATVVKVDAGIGEIPMLPEASAKLAFRSFDPLFNPIYRDDRKDEDTGEDVSTMVDYSGKWVNFMTPLNQAKVFYINTDLIIDEYDIDFSPKLIENKRAFFQALGKLNVDRTISTIYYIDGEKVMKTKRHPSYSFLRNPKHYIFSGKYDHY